MSFLRVLMFNRISFPYQLGETAMGLIYLHSIGIIHGDLKCVRGFAFQTYSNSKAVNVNVLQANIMVNDEHVAQLADFGQSTVGDGTVNGSMSNSAGHPRWLAPELMFPEIFNGSGKSTRESDVYAFGMTALEVCCAKSSEINFSCLTRISQMFTGKVPFFALPECALPLEVAINGLRPSHPGPETEARGLTGKIWRLMRRCWRQKSHLRPKTHGDDSRLVVFAKSSTVSYASAASSQASPGLPLYSRAMRAKVDNHVDLLVAERKGL